VRENLNHSARYGFTGIREYARHAGFTADESDCHYCLTIRLRPTHAAVGPPIAIAKAGKGRDNRRAAGAEAPRGFSSGLGALRLLARPTQPGLCDPAYAAYPNLARCRLSDRPRLSSWGEKRARIVYAPHKSGKLNSA